MNIYDIMPDQAWNDETLVNLLCEFISYHGLDDALETFLRQRVEVVEEEDVEGENSEEKEDLCG